MVCDFSDAHPCMIQVRESGEARQIYFGVSFSSLPLSVST
jgi:hypothetical protein